MNIRTTLKKNSDFRRLYSKGKSAVTPYMAVYCRRNKGGVNRLGYTVSTKLGHAVVRNRVRRRLREIYRLNSPRLRSGWETERPSAFPGPIRFRSVFPNPEPARPTAFDRKLGAIP